MKWSILEHPRKNQEVELLHTSSGGGTIHSYPLSGGKRTMIRFLSCYEGACEFFEDMEEATSYLHTVETSG